MRVLVVADIHSNWLALNAIEEEFDLCLCVGDVVDYGPDPLPCIDWVRKNCRYAVRGNHDHGVAQGIVATGDTGFRHLTAVTRPLVSNVISADDRAYLGRLPLTQYVRIDGKAILLVHGTPRDPLDEYLFENPLVWQRRLQHIPADIVCVGHTHHQFILDAGSAKVLNPGSVGQPRDGDSRAAYAMIEDGEIRLERIEYPVEETIARMMELPIDDMAKTFAARVLRTGSRRPDQPLTGATGADWENGG